MENILTIFYVVLIALVAVLIYYIYKSVKSFKLPDNNLICFTGTLGSGKTYLAVSYALKAYKKQRLKHFIYTHFRPFKYVCRESVYPATLYSNIPIQINLSKKNPKYSLPFTKEHLLMKEVLPERCVVLIDEIGQFCSQWEFDNPYVMLNVQTLVRFFRHFTNGKMYLTDQVSDNIVKPIRDRIGFIYQLNGFKRCLGILPFYQTDVIPILSLDNGMTNIEHDMKEEDKQFFFGVLPYMWMRIKHYESRCFKPLYTQDAIKHINNFDGLYTTYLIDISVSSDTRKDYKKSPDKHKGFLYNRSSYGEPETEPITVDISI